ncbi:MAG: hypothetical protein IJR65_02270 [Oscillospiraceae bacterium]|nr:hypothetical protein [Oscillospiraceae bacterium]
MKRRVLAFALSLCLALALISAPRYRLFNPDWDSFSLEGIVSLISGSPRLIRGGQLCYETDAASADQSRFGDKVAAGRQLTCTLQIFVK